MTTDITPTVTAVPLPLTTTFTPPSECLSDLWILQSSWNGNYTQYANLGPDDTSLCLPSGWTSQSYFSPGLACPKGYSTGRNSVADGETRATCCPVYTQSGNDWEFIQRVPEDDWKPWHTIEACYYNFTTDASALIMTQTNMNTASTGTVQTNLIANEAGINAYAVQLRWRATDLSTAASTFGAGVTSTTATEQTGAKKTAASTASSSIGSSGSSGLSTGAKVGVGIGCAVAGILIILGAIFFFLRRRRNQSEEESDSTTGFGRSGRTGPSELYGSATAPQHELDTRPQEKTEFNALNPNPQGQGFVELESPSTKMI